MAHLASWHIVHLLHVIKGCSGPPVSVGADPIIHRNIMPAPGPANPEQCRIDTTLQHASLIGYRGDIIGFLWTFTEWDMIQCCEDNADTGESSQSGDTHSVHSHRGMSPTRPAAASIFSRHKTCETRFVTVCVTCHEKVLSSPHDVTQLTPQVGSSLDCLAWQKYTVARLHLHHRLKQTS